VIDIVLHTTLKNRSSYGGRFFRAVADAAEPYLHIPQGHTAEVGISLIGPARMRALNRKHRGKPKSTDVLSFPLPMTPIKGYTAISLGDLFISPSDVRTKASEHGVSLHEQMTWTVVHGLLHLAGYDHERGPQAAQEMFALEETILQKLNVHPVHHLRH
jgi:probable rRNA maturation factor